MHATTNPYPTGSALHRWKEQQPPQRQHRAWKRHSFAYLAARFNLLLPAAAAHSVLHFIELIFLSQFFEFRTVLALTIVRLITVIVPSAWWGVMESTRQRLRDSFSQRDMGTFSLEVIRHLCRTQIACIGYAVIFTAATVAAHLYYQNHWITLWLIATAIRGSVNLWVRSYHAIAYSICRIYIPVLLFVLVEAGLLLGAAKIGQIWDSSALLFVIPIMTAFQARILLRNTRVQLRRLNLDRFITWDFKWHGFPKRKARTATSPTIMITASLLRIHNIVAFKMLFLFVWLHSIHFEYAQLILFVLMPWLTLPLFFPSLLHHDFLYHLPASRQYYYSLVAQRSRIIVCLATLIVGGLLEAGAHFTGYTELPMLLCAIAMGTAGLLLIDGYATFHQQEYRALLKAAALWYPYNIAALLLCPTTSSFLLAFIAGNLVMLLLSRLHEASRHLKNSGWLHHSIWERYVSKNPQSLTLVLLRHNEGWTLQQKESWLRSAFMAEHNACAAAYNRAYSLLALENAANIPDLREKIIRLSGGTLKSIGVFHDKSNDKSLKSLLAAIEPLH